MTDAAVPPPDTDTTPAPPAEDDVPRVPRGALSDEELTEQKTLVLAHSNGSR